MRYDVGMMSTVTGGSPMIHPSLEAAQRVTDSAVAAPSQVRAAVAAYAYENQVAVWHADWAVRLHTGQAMGTCACQGCERAGLTRRIERAAGVARGEFLTGLREVYGAVSAYPEGWVSKMNTATGQAATAEARRVLAELEAARQN